MNQMPASRSLAWNKVVELQLMLLEGSWRVPVPASIRNSPLFKVI